MAKNYYRGADAVVLVYDVTQAKTFVNVPGWLEELETFSLDERNILQVIVANKVTIQYLFCIPIIPNYKVDLASQRQVSTMCGQALADKFKLDYLETSARSGFNVELVFRILAESLSLAHLNQKCATEKAQEEVASKPKSLGKSDAKLRDYRRFRRQHSSTPSESFRLQQARSLDYTTEENIHEQANCCVT